MATMKKLFGAPNEGVLTDKYVSFNYHELLDLELKRAYRGKQPLALLLISFPPAFQERAGELVSVMESLLRDIDSVIYYAPQKILALLPLTGKEGALYALERVTQALDSLEYLSEVPGYNDFAAAVATFPEDAVDKEGLFARLEEQLRE